MITEWLIQVGAGFVTFLGTLFSPLTLPDWMTSTMTTLYSFLDGLSGLAPWVPWAQIGVALGMLVTVYGGSFAVKLLRVALSHLPEIGGSG